MADWIPTAIAFGGTIDHFDAATRIYDKSVEPLRIREIEHSTVGGSTSVYFLSAWAAPCCLARTLSILCPEQPVIFDWVDIWCHQRQHAVFLAGEMTVNDCRDGHARVSWSAATKIAQLSHLDYDDSESGDFDDYVEIPKSEVVCRSECHECRHYLSLKPLGDAGPAAGPHGAGVESGIARTGVLPGGAHDG